MDLNLNRPFETVPLHVVHFTWEFVVLSPRNIEGSEEQVRYEKLTPEEKSVENRRKRDARAQLRNSRKRQRLAKQHDKRVEAMIARVEGGLSALESDDVVCPLDGGFGAFLADIGGQENLPPLSEDEVLQLGCEIRGYYPQEGE